MLAHLHSLDEQTQGNRSYRINIPQHRVHNPRRPDFIPERKWLGELARKVRDFIDNFDRLFEQSPIEDRKVLMQNASLPLWSIEMHLQSASVSGRSPLLHPTSNLFSSQRKPRIML
jgi:hypothetical protein